MRYLFFGTPDFATVVLGKLIEAGFPPAGVVCNPDRPVGRKKIITPPPVKILALKHGIPVFQPEKLLDLKLEISNFKFDFFVVAAYSKIIPGDILTIPRLGTVGVHPSLLPKYRGATPIQSAILAGEKETGVALYAMDEKVDHGAVISSSKFQISNDDTYETLERKLAESAGNLLVEILPRFADDEVKATPQDESLATSTKKFATQDGFVDLEKDDPIMVERKVRALNPEPGVWTMKDSKRMKILKASFLDGKLKLEEIQYEGKKPQIL